MQTLNALEKSDEPRILHKHEPYSAAFMCVDNFSPSINQPWSYVGKRCVAQMIIKLNKMAQECIKKMKDKQTKYGYNRERAILSLQSDLSLSLKKSKKTTSSSKIIATSPETTEGQLATCATSAFLAIGACWYFP